MQGTFLSCHTLVDLLRLRAFEQPEQRAYTFLAEEGEERITYGQLDRRARAFAATLQGLNATGQRALLLYQPGLEYISAFFGCLYAGVLAVPAYPPRLNGNLERLQAVVSDAQATFALTTTSILAQVERRLADSPEMRAMNWLATDEVSNDLADAWHPPIVTSDTLAFLQYTSGSTSAPKGVMLSHGNLLHNLQLIQDRFETTSASRGVIWLPPYHDMGLIGGILQPLFTGYPMTLMAPVTFIQRPLQWLQAISDTKATVSGGPNFAYDLCVQKITPEQRDQLDLSHWEQAFTGAEPIRAETLKRFAEYFAPCGFRKEAFYACYGLAEGTLLVTGGVNQEPPVVETFSADLLEQHVVLAATGEAEGELVRTLVSSGRVTVSEPRVEIVNPETGMRCAGDQVGEIWVSGASVAQGYWNRPKLTEETFRGFLPETGEGPFLRTGDLGFVRNGELFVTGRMKDLIIIRGRNYYPQDIELSVQLSHVAVRNSNGAAFSVEVGDEEKLVVVQEIERQYRRGDHDEVVQAIRQAVAEEHQLQVHAVVLIKPASIPKTSSGKIQHHACRERFLVNTLDVVVRDVLDGPGDLATETEEAAGTGESQDLSRSELLALAPDERNVALESYLVRTSADVLQVASGLVKAEQPLTAVGLDSLMAVDLKNRLEEKFGAIIPLARFLEGSSVAQLAAEVLLQLEQENTQPEAAVMIDADASEFALSYGQRSLWFLQRLAPDSAAYNIGGAARIRQALDVEALQRAFDRLVQRHAALQTNFGLLDGNPVQRVQEAAQAHFVFEAAQAWSEQALYERLVAEAYRPFDLEHGALFRVHLFQRGAEEYVLLLTTHHIVSDFWSVGVLVEELQELYAAEQRGRIPALADVRQGYKAFVEREAHLLAGAEGERMWQYWQEKLSGELPILALPTDFPRPPVQTYVGAAHTFRLPSALSQAIQKIAKAHGATYYTVFLAALQVLLHRYTGQEDILVGSPTSGRNSASFAGMVGDFVNPIVLRADFSRDLSFADFLREVKQTVLGAIAHQEYPFPLLVDKLQLKRDPAFPPLAQVMFTYQQAQKQEQLPLSAFAVGEPGVQLQVGELLLESLPYEQKFVRFDLSLWIAEVDGDFAGRFEYNTDLFAAETIQRMVGHFQTLLESIVNDAEQTVTQLPILTEPERHQLLVEWNRTAVDYGHDGACLHHFIERQAEQRPDAIAVVFEARSLTYRELNERANQLAHLLQKLGIGPDSLVGISLERSIEMIVALYGVLKAGGGYVPLDPEYPAERLAIIVEDAQLPVLLTREGLMDNLPTEGTHVICFDRDRDVLAQESTENPVVDVREENVAYVIYTSGSTGKPKGVLQTHRATVNHMLWMFKVLRFHEHDRILLKASFSFDASVTEIFGALMAGGQLVLTPLGWQQNMELMLNTLIEKQITVFNVVPSLLRMVLEMNRPEALQNVRMMLTGAELLPAELKDRLFTMYDGEFYNLYGPTEVCIDGTFWDTKRKEYPRIVPVGRPIDNMEVYILDKHLQPVPIGLAGEIHFGGYGLARGYLNRPEVTAEKFIPHPFRQEEGARLYKTGDLGRFLPCGNLEYLGRLDFQVKIRGFRIELGEIESTLKQHPLISQALVTARQDVSGEQYLIAYLIAEPGMEAPSNSELRDFLQKTLPAYMVPALFQTLDAFPLTPSGKVDRKLLPVPEPRAEAEVEFAAPQSELEKVIAQVWAEALGREQIGLHDNFFDMGGHSIMVVKVHRKLQEVLGRKDLSVVLIFQHPTVKALAKFLSQEEEQKEQNTQMLGEQSQDRAETRREMMKQRGQARVPQRTQQDEGDDWDE